MRSFLPTQSAWHCLAKRLRLSMRERQIAEAILEDRKEAAIAERLGISPHTVHTHLERLYSKLGVSSRVQLVVRLARESIACISTGPVAANAVCNRRTAGQCPLRKLSPS